MFKIRPGQDYSYVYNLCISNYSSEQHELPNNPSGVRKYLSYKAHLQTPYLDHYCQQSTFPSKHIHLPESGSLLFDQQLLQDLIMQPKLKAPIFLFLHLSNIASNKITSIPFNFQPCFLSLLST